MKKLLRLLPALALMFCAVQVRSADIEIDDEEVDGAIEYSRLVEILNTYFAAVMESDPEEATMLGIHGADNLLTARTADQIAKKTETFKNLLARINELQCSRLSADRCADYQALRSSVELELYRLEQVQPYKTSPRYYLSALDSVYYLMGNDFMDYNTRAANAISRLEQLPGVLLEAERNFYHPPKMWLQLAIAECDTSLAHMNDLDSMFDRYVELDPALKQRVDATIADAGAAIKRFRTYLAGDAMVQADGDWRAGKDAYAFYLKHWHGVDFSAGSAASRSKSIYEDTRRAFLRELGLALSNRDVEPSDFDSAMALLVTDHPAQSAIVSSFQQEIERSYQYFDKLRLIPVPRQRLKIYDVPGYRMALSPFAYYEAPAPLDTVRIGGLYVDMPPKTLSAEKREQQLRALFNYPYISMVVTQEIVPGRHLHDTIANDSSRFRKLYSAPFLLNGWASYAQQLAFERGFFDAPYSKMVFLRWKMVRAARGYLDVQMHTGQMDYDEAMEFLISDAGLSPEQAKAEIANISLHPTEYLAYELGAQEITKLRDRWQSRLGKKFDLRDFHKVVMSMSNVPFSSMDGILQQYYSDKDK